VVDRQQKTIEEQQRKWMEQLTEKVTMLKRLVNTLTGRNMLAAYSNNHFR
jgi:cell division protein FtsB